MGNDPFTNYSGGHSFCPVFYSSSSLEENSAHLGFFNHLNPGNYFSYFLLAGLPCIYFWVFSQRIFRGP